MSKMHQAGKAVYWLYEKLVYSFLIAGGILISTAITLAVIFSLPFNLQDSKDPTVTIAIIGLSTLPGILILFLMYRGFRWRLANPEAHAIEQASKLAAREAAIEAAKHAPPGPVDRIARAILQILGGLLVYAFSLLMVLVVLYVAYLAIAAMPVPLAIIIGAVIVGSCIVASKRP